MEPRYFFSDLAKRDMESIVNYLISQNIDVADKFINALFDSLSLLAKNPDMGHWRKDLTEKPVKFWTFKWHYLVVYKPKMPLEVVRVFSGLQNVKKSLK